MCYPFCRADGATRRPQAGRLDGVWLFPSEFHTKEGVVEMTDFEILSIVLMTITLLFVAMSYGRKDK